MFTFVSIMQWANFTSAVGAEEEVATQVLFRRRHHEGTSHHANLRLFLPHMLLRRSCWHQIRHLFHRVMDLAQRPFSENFQTNFPFSYDTPTFWHNIKSAIQTFVK